MRGVVAVLVFGLPLTAGAVIGGEADAGDPAVVSLVRDGQSRCSGTLVAPDRVLTAGHCVSPLGGPTHVVVGPDVDHPQQTVRIARWEQHPRYTRMGAPYDFALLTLERAVAGVEPVPLARAPVDVDDLGSDVRHVGFGLADEAGHGAGVKRAVTYPVTRVEPLVFWSGAPGQQTCDGDSGGPALMAREPGREELVGVVSDGQDCHTDGWDGQVSEVADWVDLAVAQPPPAGCATTRGALSNPAVWAAAAVLLWGPRRRRPRA